MKKQVWSRFDKIKHKAIRHPNKTIAIVGFSTFFFGFGAAALLNFYLIYTHNPFIEHLRSSLDYKSAIFGDGIVLPVVNMLVAAFLLKYNQTISKKLVQVALFSGIIITAYFHITQAMQGLVNWAMPTPWHWNILGLWHALYMLSVCSFLSLFYLVVIKVVAKEKRINKNILAVSCGIILFFLLLKLDYYTVSISNAFTSDVTRTQQEIHSMSSNLPMRNLTPFEHL